jgi:DNA-binding protein
MARLPLATVERILRDAGAKRVSKQASEEFSLWIEKLTKDIASEAGDLAGHSGRRTITERDIMAVRKRMKL